jgi:biuret amidohydrolase
MNTGFAVIALHFQNAVVHPDGVVARRGNAAQIGERHVLQNVRSLFRHARECGVPIVHVATTTPAKAPATASSAPMFKAVFAEGIFAEGSWGAAFHEDVAPEAGEKVLHHAGLLSFPNTDLGEILRAHGVQRVAVCGVATRLVVEAAVFELTDRGFVTYVIEDCCASARADLHDQSVEILRGFATMLKADDARGLFTSAGQVHTGSTS